MKRRLLVLIAFGSLLALCRAFAENAAEETTLKTESSPHAKALMLVMQTQQEVIREVEKECPWWFDTMTREWCVQRPVAPGFMDSTHWFEVSYLIDGEIVAKWSVNTDPEYADEKVRLIQAKPISIPDDSAEQQKHHELLGLEMLRTQPLLGAFTNAFKVSDVSAKSGSTYGVYFLAEDEWCGDFIPKTSLPCDTMAELIFPIGSNDLVQVGLAPDRVLHALNELCEAPFIRELIDTGGRIRLRAAGDRLHWDSDMVKELILVLKNNGYDPPSFKDWMEVVIDLSDKHKMISLYHPTGIDIYVVGEFDVVETERWREQYLQITRKALDESSPYIDEKYIPVVDEKGDLKLLERATGNNDSQHTLKGYR